MTTLATVTTALVTAGSSVDKAVLGADAACTAWARFVAARLVGDKPSLTMTDVETTLVAACMAAAKPKQRKEIGTIGSLARNGFPTVYGWYRMLVRIHAANRLADLLYKKDGKFQFTLQTLGRSLSAVQPKKPRKASGGKAKADKPETVAANNNSQQATKAAASLTLGWAEVRAFLVQARKAGATKGLMSHEADISVCVAEIGNIARLIENKHKANRKAKTVGTVAKTAKARKAA